MASWSSGGINFGGAHEKFGSLLDFRDTPVVIVKGID
jgi:hypothetical protein